MESKEIIELRKSLGMTQQEFAVALGVTITAVSRWENGKNKPSKLAVLAIKNLENKSMVVY
jgi:DNA-binding transcriptional regulator YiaG